MKRQFLVVLALLFLLSVLPVGASAAEQEALFTTADLMDATVAELLAAMERGALTSERLTQMYLDRIAVYDPLLQTVISLNENALDEARAADLRRENGTAGRLNGIPILVKDNIDVAGMVTSDGSIYYRNDVADSDAEVIRRLSAEGAVILGKTNMAEHAVSGTTSFSTILGDTCNAYDPARTPAGSSGGSAVAVTCNFAALALGTDTGSSIRRPASFANLYGLRPSFGTVSQTGQVLLNREKDTIGLLCRSAEDLALLLDVIAGEDGAQGDGHYTDSLDADVLSGLRIGYLSSSFGWGYDYFEDEAPEGNYVLSDGADALVRQTLSVFLEAGAQLVDVSKYLSDGVIFAYGQDGQGYASEQFRQYVMAAFAEAGVDVIAYVSQVDFAEPLETATGRYDNPAGYICDLAPVAGLPDLCLPMGLSADGLPLGMDLVAEYGNDALLLSIACAYEARTDVRVQPTTTPALPDAALAELAAELTERAQAALAEEYTEESLAQLAAALEALEAMRMEMPTIEDGFPKCSKGGVDAATYQTAAQELAAAYDALTAPQPTEAPAAAEAAAPEENKGVPTAYDAQSRLPLILGFCGLLAAAALVTWMICRSVRRK